MSENAVLLVENEKHWRDWVTSVLNGVCRVDCAENSDDALNLADDAVRRGVAYKVAILDLELEEREMRAEKLPDGRGIEVYDGHWLFHELDVRHDLSVIVMTLHDTSAAARAADKMGAYAFLPKPKPDPVTGFKKEDTEAWSDKLRDLVRNAMARQEWLDNESAVAGSGYTGNYAVGLEFTKGVQRELKRGPLTIIALDGVDPKNWRLLVDGDEVKSPAPNPFLVLAYVMERDIAQVGDIFNLLDYEIPKTTQGNRMKRKINSVQVCISALRKTLKPYCGGRDPFSKVWYEDDSGVRRVTGWRLIWPLEDR